jgi:polyphosphate kinase 2 (PPK2 family)
MAVADQFRVKSDFVLKETDANRKVLGAAVTAQPDAKSIDKLQTFNLAEKIADLQNVFVASKAPKLLIILQGMDTSGKDGTVKGVFGQINPLGARTVALRHRVRPKRTTTICGAFTRRFRQKVKLSFLTAVITKTC